MTLQRMDLDTLTSTWRPGSHDTADTPDGANLEWTWAHEHRDLWLNDEHREVTLGVLSRVADEGIGFDDHLAPILLGNDGRVWDGHHRICIALALGIDHVMVDVVAPEGTSGGGR